MVSRVQGPGNAVLPGGGGTIRPMYGIFIRDSVAKFRDGITATLNDTKKAIAMGKAKGPEVIGDGVLQGKEMTKAKAAVKDLEKAVKSLKPVFANIEPAVDPF